MDGHYVAIWPDDSRTSLYFGRMSPFSLHGMANDYLYKSGESNDVYYPKIIKKFWIVTQ